MGNERPVLRAETASAQPAANVIAPDAMQDRSRGWPDTLESLLGG